MEGETIGGMRGDGEQEGISSVQHLSYEEIKAVQQWLLDRKEVIRKEADSLIKEAEEQTSAGSGELSSLPTHLADMASDTFDQERIIGSAERKGEEALEIDLALERITDGSFGRCEECEEPISRERLRAIPYARLCLECRRKEEDSHPSW